MRQVNKYPNRETYTADARRSPNKSSVSLVEQNGALLCDGVNIVVDASSACVGDLAVYDRTQDAIRFVKGTTLLPARLSAELVPVAVVYAVRGEKVHVVSLDNLTTSTNQRWAYPYEVALSGFNLAAGGTVVLKFATGSLAIELPITYSAGAKLADIAAPINANTTLQATYGWTATVDEANSRIILSSNTWSAAYAAIEVVSGCEITRTLENKNYQITLTGALIEGTSEYLRRTNGVDTVWAGCNPEKFLQYYSASGSTNTGQTPGGSEVIRESVFTEEANPALVAVYPSYRDYLLGEHMLQYPAAYGALIRDGRENTAKIGGLRFTDIRGKSTVCYPAAAAALEYGITVEGATTGLEPGAWWLPSVEEIILLMRDRALSAADLERDPVNRTLVGLGRAACYGSGYYPWTSCECSSSYAFLYSGHKGSVDCIGKCGANAVRPVSIISKS